MEQILSRPDKQMQAIDVAAFNQSSFASVVLCPFSGQILCFNTEFAHVVRATDTEILNQNFSHYLNDQLPHWIVLTEETIHYGHSWSDLHSLYDSETKLVPIELSARKIVEGSKILLLLSFYTLENIRYHREKSEANKHYRSGIEHWERIAKVFREFERENQLLLDAAGEGIYGVDADGNTTFFNTAAEKMLEWKKEELIGKNIHHLIHHSHKDGERFPSKECSIYKAFKDGITRNVDNEVFWTKNGRPIDVEYTSTPIEDNGFLVGAVVIFRDVTDKRKNQKQLIAALAEVKELKTRLEMENAYLQEEINSEFNHHHIVGKSPAIQEILQKIQMVAPTQTTTLITGESGTGKELIARAIHEMSDRGHRSLIRVNCAAIPAELFESEFFGHSRGAFTSATETRIGRFELADGGTLFLDEVGEIPLSLQGKLLRVLQEQQFERVGESKTRSVDVRIIAATNQNLPELVKSGKFREDLFFRLNVFPIESIPLRKRIQDIPMLAQHFLNRAVKKTNRTDLRISLTQLENLKNYSWPGNIRELENVIERQVILAKGINLEFNDLMNRNISPTIPHENIEGNHIETEPQRVKRDKLNIISALKKSNGRVSGSYGAANILEIKPTTLASRIKKYNIDLSAFKN